VASDTRPKRKRGRRPTFDPATLSSAAGYSHVREVRTRRGEQDLVYRMFAIAVLEHYSAAFPEKGESLRWLLGPKRRHTLLTELGRFGKPLSDESGALVWQPERVSRLVAEACRIAELRPSTKAGVAMLRARRRGEQAGATS
jgi:hypothetical protein